MNRRTFISLSALVPFFGFGKLVDSLSAASGNSILNQKLKIDPKSIMDLHPALNYQLISKAGSIMSDGFKVPGLADGMGSFLVDDNIVLVRNHELVPWHGMDKSAFDKPSSQIKGLGNKHYDKDSIGGTTNVIIDSSSKKVLSEYLSLSGTQQNCAGGVTPWGTWLSCEENIDKKDSKKTPHGYVFEIDPRKKELEKPIPLKAMGRFNHEAVAFDRFNNAYLTEDRMDGLIYKFIPNRNKSLSSGSLLALQIEGQIDSRNWDLLKIKKGEKYTASWVKIDDNDPDDDTMRYEGIQKGATPFARPEGIIQSNESVFICCTAGGPLKKGQIWKLTSISPEKSVIELWYEVEDKNSINMPDNITVAPWGDLIVCEDNSKLNRLWGINSSGESYLIASNNYTKSEFAGVCFSPLDNTMFVNIQGNGMTLLIDGNWNEVII